MKSKEIRETEERPDIEELDKKIKKAVGSTNSLTAEEYSNKVKKIQNKLYKDAKKIMWIT